MRALKEYDSLLTILSDSIAHNRGYYPSYEHLLHKLYLFYKGVDSSDVAIQYLNRHIQAIEVYNGRESIAYANACIRFLNDIAFMGKALTGEASEKERLFYYLRESSEIIKRHICNSVYNMSNTERMQYWQRFKYLYTWYIPSVCGMMKEDSEAYSLAYNAALFYKGMLLSAEREIKDVVKSSQDAALMNLYNEYTHNLCLLEELYNTPLSVKATDSLKNVILDQEYTLSQKATRLNRVYKGTNFSWKEIRNKLNSEDVAIEIFSYLGFDGTSIYYDAYVIEKNSVAPYQLHLCEESQLRNCFHEDGIDYQGLSKVIWGNMHLSRIIKDKKNIYFSVSGLLNSIAFEYLPLDNGQYVFDNYNLYRLSSTRELCFPRPIVKPQKTCLYGGLDYNETSQTVTEEATLSSVQSQHVIDSLMKRGGFEPLFGSKREIEEIKNEMVRNDIECIVYTDSEGTESSFKEMTGSQIDILHFSTHGMYIPDEETIVNPSLRYALSDDNPDIDEEAVSLSHSFLVLSGGNYCCPINPTAKVDSIKIGG